MTPDHPDDVAYDPTVPEPGEGRAWAPGDRVVTTHRDDEENCHEAGEYGVIVPQEWWDDEPAISCVRVRFDVARSYHLEDGTAWVTLNRLSRATGATPDER